MGIVLTNTAKYDPFTFQELATPYIMVDKAAGEVMDIVDEYGAKADLIKKYADENPDSEYAQRYYAYSNELNKIASDMAKYGMSTDLRNRSRRLKRRYSSDINPMEEADKLFKEQRKVRLDHPDRIYAKGLTFNDAYNNTIDNTFLNEKDITESFALNYSNILTSSYNKYRDQGLNAAESYNKAINEVNENGYSNIKNSISAEKNRLSNLGFDLNNNELNSRINGAIQKGVYLAQASLLKNATLTEEQRKQEEDRLARRAMEERKFIASREDARFEKNAAIAKAKNDGYIIDNNGNLVSVSNMDIPKDPNAPIDLGNSPGLTTVKVLHNISNKFIDTNTGSLKSVYFGNKNKLNSNGIPTFVNPMEVKEAIDKVIKENPVIESYTPDGSPSNTYLAQQAKQTEAINKVYKDYGVTEVITDEEYQVLKDLGYTSKSTFNDFRNNLKSDIDYSKELDVATSINLKNYNQEEIEAAFNRDLSRNDGSLVNIVDYYSGNPITYNDITVTEGNTTKLAKINSVQYNTYYPNELIIEFVKTDNQVSAIRVPKDYFGIAYGNIISDHLNKINHYTAQLKDPNVNRKVVLQKLQNEENIVAAKIRAQMESKMQNATVTNNKVVNR